MLCFGLSELKFLNSCTPKYPCKSLLVAFLPGAHWEVVLQQTLTEAWGLMVAACFHMSCPYPVSRSGRGLGGVDRESIAELACQSLDLCKAKIRGVQRRRKMCPQRRN